MDALQDETDVILDERNKLGVCIQALKESVIKGKSTDPLWQQLDAVLARYHEQIDSELRVLKDTIDHLNHTLANHKLEMETERQAITESYEKKITRWEKISTLLLQC